MASTAADMMIRVFLIERLAMAGGVSGAGSSSSSPCGEDLALAHAKGNLTESKSELDATV